MVVQPTRWFDDEPDFSPWLKALEDVRRKATREGWCYQHVQAIIGAIDQYAEAEAHRAGGTMTSAVGFRRERCCLF
jgi:hypothetical protein